MANSAWGIDLGNRALKAIKLTREGDRFRVEDFEIVEHEQILSVSGDNKESILQTALANFVQRHKTKGVPVGVSVSGQQSFARFIKLPPVEEKKIPEIVRFEAIQQIPFPLDDVEWSYQLFRQKESPDVEVGILAIKKELVNHYVSHFTKLGLNVQCVQMHPLAVYNAMAYDDRCNQPTMFMDSGAENTDLIITDGQTVWLRTLPIGGNTFTEMLAKSFKLNFAKAEELKRNAATSKYAKQIFQAMRPVFADLVAEIQRSIGFYASVHRDARIARIVAQGSTFQLPGLQKYLQQNLQLPVEKLDSFKALPPADAKIAAAFSENLISLAGAYGLAVQALDEARITASLLPEHIRREKLWLDKSKWFAAAAATFVLGTALIGASSWMQGNAYSKNSPIRASYNGTLMKAENNSSEWKSRIEKPAISPSVTAVQSLQTYRDTWVGAPGIDGAPSVAGILSDILAFVPPFHPEQLKAIPRGKRQQILIKSIVKKYEPDLQTILDSRSLKDAVQPDSDPALSGMPGGASGGGAQPIRGGGAGRVPAAWLSPAERGGARSPIRRGAQAAPAPVAAPAYGAPARTTIPKRGFVLTIHGSTPNDGSGAYIQQTLVEQIRQQLKEDAQYAAHASYYVEKVEMVEAGKTNLPEAETGRPVAPARGGWRPTRDTPRGAFLPPPPPDAAAAPDPMDDPLRDPYFPGESIKNDTTFTIVVVVALDPKAPAKTVAAR